jgi:pimeloyl-ACP methyl ester carboxylesterase
LNRAVFAGALLFVLASFGGVRADDTSTPAPARAARTVVTHHTMHLADGAALAYTATAGTLTLRDDKNEPTANVFYVAYTTGDRKRPVTFLYNGGPGSASLWLHIGAFGPRRIVMADKTFGSPVSGQLADNPATLLDTSDLVFIDPVGTGYSEATGKSADKDFWGVDEDIRSFSQFIRRWIAANDRADSPKFLLGESYGTFRSAGLVDQLQKDGVAFNGVILVSSRSRGITRRFRIRRPTCKRSSMPPANSQATCICPPSCGRVTLIRSWRSSCMILSGWIRTIWCARICAFLRRGLRASCCGRTGRFSVAMTGASRATRWIAIAARPNSTHRTKPSHRPSSPRSPPTPNRS